MSVRATLETVATHARVSRQTVSNVLNAPHVVRPATRARVEQSIATLGYQPHRAARQLKTRRSRLIALRMERYGGGVSGSLLDQFLHGLTEATEAQGYHVMLFVADNDEGEIAAYERLRSSLEIDGFVLTTTHYGDRRTAWLEERGLPFVTFGRPWGAEGGHSWVDVDGSAGTAEATEHLVSLGHRRIAFLGWPTGSGSGDDRYAGWHRAMKAGRLPTRGLIKRCTDEVPDARAVTRALLDASAPPTAVVCASDVLALGAFTLANERTAAGAAPIAVVGFDDTAAAAALGLSSVAQPVAEAAHRCAALLVEQLSRSAPLTPEQVLLRPRLVVRASSSAVPRSVP
jgi:DNA-binding LacI/PurR family transcriptional regulator